MCYTLHSERAIWYIEMYFKGIVCYRSCHFHSLYQLPKNTEIIHLPCWNTENAPLLRKGKVLIYYQIYSNTTWRQVTANGTKNSSNSSRQTLGINFVHRLSHQTFCMHKAMVLVVVNVHLPACGCYTYSATTVKLYSHSQSVKNL